MKFSRSQQAIQSEKKAIRDLQVLKAVRGIRKRSRPTVRELLGTVQIERLGLTRKQVLGSLERINSLFEIKDNRRIPVLVKHIENK